jgi:CO/xanthine dehydrogenase Mo-binding subunit/aerobic-type carbon monoxide dehydrogenase small subunit (CoxS/CutS family)
MNPVSSPETIQLRMTVNGEAVEVDVPSGRTLLDVLRGACGLTGAKNGCDIGICGTCTVLVDGAPKKACVEQAESMQGREIVTIEGLGAPDELTPIQEAFIENTASQCGMCTPGFVVACHAYLKKNPEPHDRDKIRSYLRKNFCRCTGYEQIVDAVQEAAGLTTAGEEFDKRCTVIGAEDAEPRPVVGQVVPLVGVTDKVCGTTCYADDYSVQEGTLHLTAVRSPHAHAVLDSVDARPALAMDGVQHVWTATDIPGGDNYVGMLVRDQRVLVPVGETVKAVGDAVALVAADTQEHSRAAAAAVNVSYEILPGTYDAKSAYEKDAPVVHPELRDHVDPERRNLIHHQHIHRGDGIESGDDVEQLFVSAEGRGWHVIEGDFGTGFQDHAPLEPEVALAEWDEDEDKVVVYAPVQHVFFARRNVREALGLDNRHVRIIGTTVGGAYGKREDPYAFPYCALATWLTRKPTRMLWTREETLQYTQKRHAIDAHMRAAVDADGKIQAFQAKILLDGGAYRSWTKEITTKSAVMCSGPYEIPNVWIDTYGLYTNNPLCGACRGFGTANTMFATESFWDLVCDRCGFDKIEFRHANTFRKGSSTATRHEFERGVRSLECLEAAADTYEWGRERPRREGDWVYGTGVATIWYGNGFGRGIRDEGHPILEIRNDGKLHVWASTVDYGQGSNTVFTQVAADVLGLRPDQVVMHTADSDRTPNCGSTVASRVTVVVGKAVDLTARALRDDLFEAAARHLDAQPEVLDSEAGWIWRQDDPGTRVPFSEVAEALAEPLMRQVAKRNQEFTSPLDPVTGAGKAYWPYVFGTHIVTAGVNVKTGAVKLTEFVAAHDVGRVINPQSCRGQVIGGAAMGVGYALTEELELEEGRVISDNFDTYALPRATDLPDMDVILVEDPDLDGRPDFGPNGAKGIGEPPTIAPAPAIVSALNDALRDFGIRFNRVPVTRERLRDALRAAGVAPKKK